MFFTYLWNELRRRRRQAVVVSLGLGVGIALVVTVAAMAAGVRDAQSTVLGSLYGVGTDVTVTQAAQPGDGPPGFQVGGGGQQRVRRDVVTSSPGQNTFADTRAAQVASLDGVSQAAGGLSLTSIHINGQLPTFSDTGATPPANGGSSTQQVDPGRLNVDSSTIAGVDVTVPGVGPLSSVQVADGRGLSPADATKHVVVVDESYATEQQLTVDDSLRIGGTAFTVVGIAPTPVSGGGSDVYMPLAAAQDVAGVDGKINTIYVKATSADAIGTAKRSIQRALPDATVSTASDLAKQVSGSLSSASSLATTLGRWLAIAAVVAAIALATLLTLSSVGRRTRELGTLKALGWRTRRVVGQVMGESIAQGVLGGVLGIALGLAGAWAVAHFAPSLTATVSSFGGPGAFGGPGGGPPGAFGPGGTGSSDGTISVALHAPVSVSLAAVAVGLSLLGGAIAGLFGGVRAARMRPADAMRQTV